MNTYWIHWKWICSFLPRRFFVRSWPAGNPRQSLIHPTPLRSYEGQDPPWRPRNKACGLYHWGFPRGRAALCGLSLGLEESGCLGLLGRSTAFDGFWFGWPLMYNSGRYSWNGARRVWCGTILEGVIFWWSDSWMVGLQFVYQNCLAGGMDGIIW